MVKTRRKHGKKHSKTRHNKNSKALKKTQIQLFTTLNIIYKENATQTPLNHANTLLVSASWRHYRNVPYIRFSAFRIRWNYVNSVNGRGVTVI